jgi:ubiquinone/menaquinone biosynthesis C-methylase UbiE
MGGRGEESFAHFPGFAAKLYDGLMKTKAIELHFREIAQDLVCRISQGRLLDIGTGPGKLLLEIHTLSPSIELFGLDISAAMVQQAKRNLAGIRVDLRQGSIRATDYASGSFDLVTCSGSFYLWDSPEESLEEVHRILKEGRSAYFYETHKDFNRDELLERMKANLRGENLLRRLVAPRAMMKQLRMTYRVDEINEIIERTSFGRSYAVEEVTIVGLPIWLRIKLEKCA